MISFEDDLIEWSKNLDANHLDDEGDEVFVRDGRFLSLVDRVRNLSLGKHLGADEAPAVVDAFR